MEITNETVLKGLVGAIARGDSRSLKSLFECTHPYVHGLLRPLLGSQELIEDVIAETYTKVWRNAASYEPERGSVLSWIAAFARNRAIDLLRANARERRVSLSPEEIPDLCGADPSPLQVSQSGEEASRVRRAIRRLSKDQQRVIEAVFFKGLTHVQTAQALGEPLGTIKGRVRAAMNNLRQNLGLLGEGAI